MPFVILTNTALVNMPELQAEVEWRREFHPHALSEPDVATLIASGSYCPAD